ncbi:MAG: hypothetical protein CVU05_05435 [Bacteroidetes bacterium HGW-Bacteroidetes-21]|jgi:hypothetical protein|nr:MAG: hypothetical protein CVU05_05435 [Bacteroidetes bacterium HGW-Bacteroidetes-21]
MKAISLFVLLCITSSVIKAQSLDQFYEKSFEIYTPFVGMSSKSNSNDTLGIKPGLSFWGVANLGGSYSNTRPWGVSFSFGERQLSDMFFLLKGILNKKTKVKDFGNLNYLSDFGFLPNFRVGMNVFGQDEMIINIGLNHSYYITQTHFILDGRSVTQGVDWLALGPNIYVDRAINDWLAVRLASGPMISYANGKKIKDNKPTIWEHKIEVFTKWGLFVGIDFLNFSKFHDDNDSNIKIKRYDLKLGVRLKL